MSDFKVYDRRWLSTTVVCEYENTLWISCGNFNALYAYDIKEKELRYISGFPDEPDNAWKLHGHCIGVNGNLYFLPDTSKKIHCYNIQSGYIKKIDVGEEGRIVCDSALFIGDNIYFTSRANKKKLCILDITTNTITKKIFPEEIENNDYTTDMTFFRGEIFWGNRKKGSLLKYNINNECFEEINIIENSGFGTIVSDGENVWLTDENEIIKWSEQTNQYKLFDLPDGIGMTVMDEDKLKHCRGFRKWSKPNEKPFAHSCCINGKILFFPFRTNSIVEININDEESVAKIFDIPGEIEDKVSLLNPDRLSHRHYFSGDAKDGIIFISTATKYVYKMFENREDRVEKYLLWAEDVHKLNFFEHGTAIKTEWLDGSLDEFISDLL